MLLVVHLIMIVVLILLGILFHFGKGADLIAGYNTLPAEKKAEYDVKKLCKYMSKLMFALAVCCMYKIQCLQAIFLTGIERKIEEGELHQVALSPSSILSK